MEHSGDTPAEVLTQRLVLTRVTMADLDAIAALHADERVWRHRPEGRHPNAEYSRGKVLQMLRQWADDGLGYWIARLRHPLADLAAGEFVGIGGCAVDSTHNWWNLYYRLRPETQGHKLATELSQAALNCAHARDPDRPVVASLIAQNHASRVTAERAGLQLQWQGPDQSRPGTTRQIYADRPLDLDRTTS